MPPANHEPAGCVVPPHRGRRDPHAHRLGRAVRGAAAAPSRTSPRWSRRKLPLVPRYRQVVRFVPLRTRPARCGSTTRTSTSSTTCGTRRCPRPGGEGELRRLVGRRDVSAARPRQAAVGDLDRRGPGARALGAAVQDPPLHGRRRLGHRSARLVLARRRARSSPRRPTCGCPRRRRARSNWPPRRSARWRAAPTSRCGRVRPRCAVPRRASRAALEVAARAASA